MEVKGMDKVTTYRDKPIEDLTKEELIVALNEMATFYKARLEDKDKLVNLLKPR